MSDAPTTFGEMVAAVTPKPKMFTVGTVAAVNEGEALMTVAPEDGGQEIVDVPLRIMRNADGAGVIVIPKVGTQVVVAWLGEHRATLLKCQEWTKILIQTPAKFGMVVDAADVVTIGRQNDATHPVAWGDTLAVHLAALQAYLDAQIGVPSPVPPGDLISADVYTS
jgi:hypothetical protein